MPTLGSQPGNGFCRPVLTPFVHTGKWPACFVCHVSSVSNIAQSRPFLMSSSSQKPDLFILPSIIPAAARYSQASQPHSFVRNHTLCSINQHNLCDFATCNTLVHGTHYYLLLNSDDTGVHCSLPILEVLQTPGFFIRNSRVWPYKSAERAKDGPKDPPNLLLFHELHHRYQVHS